MTDVGADDGQVVVNVQRVAAPPTHVSQLNCAAFGFDTAGYLAFIRRHAIAYCPSGRLRIVRADALDEAIRANARVRPRRQTSAPMRDDAKAAAEAAGLAIR